MGCINVTSCIFEGCNNPNEHRQHQQHPRLHVWWKVALAAASVPADATLGMDNGKGHSRHASAVAARGCGVRVWLLRHGACQWEVAWGLRWTMSEA